MSNKEKRRVVTFNELWRLVTGTSDRDVLNDPIVMQMLKQVQLMIDEGAFEYPHLIEPISICKMHSSVRVAKMSEGVLRDLRKEGITIQYLVNIRVGDFPHLLMTGEAEKSFNSLYPNMSVGIGDREIVRFFFIFTELIARYGSAKVLWDEKTTSRICGWKSRTLCRRIDEFLGYDYDKIDLNEVMDRAASLTYFDDLAFFEGLFSGEWMISHRKGSKLQTGEIASPTLWTGFPLTPKLIYMKHPEYSLFDWRYFEFGKVDIAQVNEILLSYDRLKLQVAKMKKQQKRDNPPPVDIYKSSIF